MPKNKKYCVYKNTFPNDKVYIGITCQKPELRWGKNGTGYAKVNQKRMYNAIQKYGWENIKHEILEKNLTLLEANDKERYYITQIYHSNNLRFGYNLTNGGKNKGLWSKAMRKKLSIAHQNQKCTPETRQKLSENNAKYWKGKTFSKQHRKNISTSKRGHIPWNKGLKGVYSTSCKGKKIGTLIERFGKEKAEAINKKRSESLKRVVHTKEWIEKVRIANKLSYLKRKAEELDNDSNNK